MNETHIIKEKGKLRREENAELLPINSAVETTKEKRRFYADGKLQPCSILGSLFLKLKSRYNIKWSLLVICNVPSLLLSVFKLFA